MNQTILEKIREAMEYIQASCNGRGVCGQCRIIADLEVSEKERKLLREEEINNGIRLACCHAYHDGLEYTIPHVEMDITDEMITTEYRSHEDAHYCIVDLGTTTVVMKTVDMNTGEVIHTSCFVNPEASYGADVISRIAYDNAHPHVLHDVLIRKMKEELQDVKKMILCGNTTMTHLFIDSDVKSIGEAPFHVPHKERVVLDGSMFESQMEIMTFPHISAYVGGDIVSGIYALHMHRSDQTMMLLDLGTNGEIACGNKRRIVTASTAAGPAFEGVGISCGGASVNGAISKVMIKDGTVTYETIGNVKAETICGSGLISLVAELKRNDLIDEMGHFHEGTRFDITDHVFITEKDIHTFQLAKAAIYAGIQVLLKEVSDVDEIHISGGFGTHIDPDDLIELNMIPEKFKGKIFPAKNSALSGVYQCVMKQEYDVLDEIAEMAENIDLSRHPDFNDLLVDGLYFEN